MTLRVADLLADPDLGLKLVAGGRGLEGGEVLLLTGLGIRDREDLQRALVAGLDACDCAGIGFGVGVVLDAPPAALRGAVDLHRAVLAAVVGGRGAEAVLRTAVGAMHEFAALVLDPYGRLLARHDPGSVAAGLDSGAVRRDTVPHPPPHRFEVSTQALVPTGAAIHVGEEVEALLLRS